MNNEVPGASVPVEILERMRKTNSKEEAFFEGIKIAQETFQQVRSEVNGIQLSAPLGRIDAVMMVLED
jgi:homocysteine S-methyltransferase